MDSILKTDPVYSNFVKFLECTNQTTASYHTTEHMIGVASILYNMNLSDKYSKDLVMAGLFHDYFYDVSLSTDNEKIKTTLFHVTDKTFLSDVSKVLIEYTEYPYTQIKPEHEYLAEHIDFIRSADMVYSTVFCSHDVLHGLYLELKNSMKFSTFKDFLLRNIDFISNTKFNNKYFKKLNARHLHTAISYHLELIKEQNDRI